MYWSTRKEGKYIVTTLTTGDECWTYNNLIHREDGPAMSLKDGTKLWYLNDKFLTEEEHKRIISLKVFW